MVNVLIACEFSGRVRDAFTARGHYAMSCDLLPSETPGPHYQGDVRDLLDEGWDLMIAHPPCIYLSTVGGAWWHAPGRAEKRAEALAFVRELMNAPIPRIAIENPVGAINTNIRKPDQYIQPWEHGDPYMKKTGLWLKNLPPLKPTNIVEPIGYWVSSGSNRTRARNDYYLGHRDPKVRARTFAGIANAMAEQWGNCDNSAEYIQ